MKTSTMLLATLLFTSQAAHSGIAGGEVSGGISKERGGVFEKLSPPIGKVGDNNHQSPNLFGFDEKQNTTLDKPLQVDILVDKGAIVQNKGPKTVAASQSVASHYVFYDPVNGDIKGKVRFDADIVAIITSTNTLKASDFLATGAATYLNSSARGLETNDHIRLTGPREIFIDFTAGRPGDYIRVLTRIREKGE